jgi:UDP-2,4-diacetamido-2,4,6-trideoxy-beta-L-altropyranose hydrolase
MRLLVRADSSSRIGSGHVMRTLALAQAAKDAGHEVAYAAFSMLDGPAARLRSEGIDLHLIDATAGSDADLSAILALVSSLRADRVIVDGYDFDARWDDAFAAANLGLLRVDDIADQPAYRARWLLNQNPYAARADYPADSPSRFLLGADYLMLRREFRRAERPRRDLAARPRRILVTFGGADPGHHSLPAVAALQPLLGADGEILVLLGSGYTGPAIPEGDGLSVLRDVTDMPALLASVDAAIAAAGSTVYELAWMQVPALLVQTAPNQARIADYLASSVPELCLRPEALPLDFGAAVATLLDSASARGSMLSRFGAASSGDPTLRLLDALVAP